MSGYKLGLETFSLRAGERVVFSGMNDGSDAEYAVMLLETPSLPMEHEEHAQLCVIAARRLLAGRWGWMQLSPYTKEMIGRLMEDLKLSTGQWFEMVILPRDEGSEVAE